MVTKKVLLNTNTLNKLIYERSKYWSELLEKFRRVEEGPSFELQQIEEIYIDNDNVDISEAEENGAADAEDLEVLEEINKLNSQDLAHQTSNTELQNFLNETVPIFTEHERQLKKAGIEKILNTFNSKLIEEKVGAWLIQNSEKFKATCRLSKRHHESTDDDSSDEANYVRQDKIGKIPTSSKENISKDKRSSKSSTSMRRTIKKKQKKIVKRKFSYGKRKASSDGASGYCGDDSNSSSSDDRDENHNKIICKRSSNSTLKSFVLDSSMNNWLVEECPVALQRRSLDTYVSKKRPLKRRTIPNAKSDESKLLKTKLIKRKEKLKQNPRKDNKKIKKLEGPFQLPNADASKRFEGGEQKIFVDFQRPKQVPRNCSRKISTSQQNRIGDNFFCNSLTKEALPIRSSSVENQFGLVDSSLDQEKKLGAKKNLKKTEETEVSSTTYLLKAKTDKGILVYSPSPNLNERNVSFSIKKEHLSGIMGEKYAEKFLKYYIGRRTFDGNSSVYYKPTDCRKALTFSKNDSVIDWPEMEMGIDTDSDDDEETDVLERIGKYGELYECFPEPSNE